MRRYSTRTAQVPGATFKPMEGMGHFPMSENPEVFKAYLMPYLEAIRELAQGG